MNSKFILIEYAPRRIVVARRIDNRPDEYVVWHVTQSLEEAQKFCKQMNRNSSEFERLDEQADSALDLLNHPFGGAA